MNLNLKDYKRVQCEAPILKFIKKHKSGYSESSIYKIQDS